MVCVGMVGAQHEAKSSQRVSQRLGCGAGFFDADRPVSGEYAIQSWATDSFGGLQRTLLYPFLAKGIPIPEPRFVRPGSHPCLELADFVSFVVARYLWQLHQGKEIEFQPARLGKVFYMVRRRNGGLLQLRQTGYPSAEPC